MLRKVTKIIVQINQQLSSTDLLVWIILDCIDVIILTCIGTDDHRVKTFLMQHTGSRICYLSLSKWCLGHFMAWLLLHFSACWQVFLYNCSHKHESYYLMRSAQQSLVRVPLNPPPPPPTTTTTIMPPMSNWGKWWHMQCFSKLTSFYAFQNWHHFTIVDNISSFWDQVKWIKYPGSSLDNLFLQFSV